MEIRSIGNNPKIQRNKAIITVTLVLMLSVASLMACISTANAAINYPTFAFLIVSPDPIGIGQTGSAIMFLNMAPPSTQGVYSWTNFKLTMTKPDGTTKVFTLKSDSAATAYTAFTPDAIGTYTFSFSFGGESVPNGDYYMPSTSGTKSITVQQQQTSVWTETPVPTSYWTRPINAQNREWSSISGNWLYATRTSNPVNLYTSAPESSHIIWRKQIQIAGLIGGEFGTTQYYPNEPYEASFTPPTIISGILYYNTAVPPRYGFTAVDLRTGETLWYQNSTVFNQPLSSSFGGVAYSQITLGQVLDFESASQYGGLPYLWDTTSPTWSMYDANTGNCILSFANASAGTITRGSYGELLEYVLYSAGNVNWLAMWNSTLALKNNGMYYYQLPVPNEPPSLRLYSGTYDWTKGIQWNVTVPTVMGQAISGVSSGVVLATAGAPSIFPSNGWQMEIGYDANTGQQLWIVNRTQTLGGLGFNLMGAIGDGVYCEWDMNILSWNCFSLQTGEKLWGPTKISGGNDWAFYQNAIHGSSRVITNGKLYAVSYDGCLRCFDLRTGQQDWVWSTGSSGFNTQYGNYPAYGGIIYADGKVYVPTAESFTNPPMGQGFRVYCVDAETGQGLWNMSGSYNNLAIADGYIVGFNQYDGEVYCFGKGQSATTVAATPGHGNAVTIQGTVTDQSPGETCLGIPAAGTQAISDDSMTSWMEYLYMQRPMPTNATGVPVTIVVSDENNNAVYTTSATSDVSGHYIVSWTPTTQGVYKITTTFDGSESYYPSTDTTGIAIGEAVAPQVTPTVAPTQTAQPTQTPAPTISASPTVAPTPGTGMSTETLLIAGAAVVIIIAVGAAALVLRKRK